MVLTITFEVALDPALIASPPELSAQGTITGGSFPDIVTDDPDSAPPADATLTPLVITDCNMNDRDDPARCRSGTRASEISRRA